jgi:hypothetical protein
MSERSSTGHQLEHDRNHRDDEQKVDQGAADMEGEKAEKPPEEKDDGKGVKQGWILLVNSKFWKILSRVRRSFCVGRPMPGAAGIAAVQAAIHPERISRWSALRLDRTSGSWRGAKVRSWARSRPRKCSRACPKAAVPNGGAGWKSDVPHVVACPHRGSGFMQEMVRRKPDGAGRA